MIEARGLTKRYGGRAAVDRAGFTVRPGRVTGFLGPDGAGKSTTMRMIVGLDRPTAGDVTVGGRRPRDLRAPLREVGALLDAGAVHGGRSAYHHLLCLARSNRVPKRRVHEVIELAGLQSVARKPAKRFSPGMLQRLGIAAALLGDPGVLVFDEPLSGLDPDGGRWVRDLLRRLAAEGRTVFVSGKVMPEMARIADDVLVIGRGRILADACVREFIGAGAAPYVRVRSPQLGTLAPILMELGWRVEPEQDGAARVYGARAAQIGDVAADRGMRLYELETVQPSLEEAFMRFTRNAVEYRAEVPAPPPYGAPPKAPLMVASVDGERA